MEKFDIYLSSGYLSFAAHLGFMKAIEDDNIKINSISGVSSGAIIGSLFSNGLSVDDIKNIIKNRNAISFLSINKNKPYNGLFNMNPLEEILSSLLPSQFEQIPISFQCGVVNANREFEMLSSGYVVESVIASCSVPYLFVKKNIPDKDNNPFVDGGILNRVGLLSSNPKIIHVIDDTFGKKNNIFDDKSIVINSKRSKSSLWKYNNFDGQFEESRETTKRLLDGLTTRF
ncbi:hypothetical protein VT25_14265 [Photobacterium leiognathi subsp. mandapamensis]|nr:hypothetical protein VT25_14265 [Photobacterium leiognathi subsp. mandapamensis]